MSKAIKLRRKKQENEKFKQIVVFNNEAENERDILLRYKQQINRMCDNGDLIPFGPAYDL